jgi:endoglucanase
MRTLFTIILFIISITVYGQKAAYPFPVHAPYHLPFFKPIGSTPKQMDDSTTSFYRQWKNEHVRHDCPEHSMYYVFDNEHSGRKKGTICISEGQGYGMMIMALMAGYDAEAKTIFDGMYLFYKSHPSAASAYLMTWEIEAGCKSKIARDNNFSATDGDMDIAFSLLLADAQWGSGGAINYRREAVAMIAEIAKHEINPTNYTIVMSDALESSDPRYNDMRTSDFMPDHFREFFTATGDSLWLKVIDKGYQLFDQLQKQYAPITGLLPDFVQYTTHGYAPAKAKYLESDNDGQFYYNACRTPWRLTSDYLAWGDARAFRSVVKMNQWIRKKVLNKPFKLYAGYYLDGKDILDNDYSTPAFVCPFVVSASIDANAQLWLSDLWNYLLTMKFDDYKYYDNTLRMLTMIVLSGNYWTPGMMIKK